MKIQALILAPAPNIKMVLFCLHFFTSQLLLSEALLRLVAVPDTTNYLLSRAPIIHFCLVYFAQLQICRYHKTYHFGPHHATHLRQTFHFCLFSIAPHQAGRLCISNKHFALANKSIHAPCQNKIKRKSWPVLCLCQSTAAFI